VPKKAVKPQRKQVVKPTAAPVVVSPGAVPDLSEVLWPLTTLRARPEPKDRSKGRSKGKSNDEPRRRGIDVGAVITRALTAAGLMK